MKVICVCNPAPMLAGSDPLPTPWGNFKKRTLSDCAPAPDIFMEYITEIFMKIQNIQLQKISKISKNFQKISKNFKRFQNRTGIPTSTTRGGRGSIMIIYEKERLSINHTHIDRDFCL